MKQISRGQNNSHDNSNKKIRPITGAKPSNHHSHLFDQASQNGTNVHRHKHNESFSVLSSQGALSSNANMKIYKNKFPLDFFQNKN